MDDTILSPEDYRTHTRYGEIGEDTGDDDFMRGAMVTLCEMAALNISPIAAPDSMLSKVRRHFEAQGKGEAQMAECLYQSGIPRRWATEFAMWAYV